MRNGKIEVGRCTNCGKTTTVEVSEDGSVAPAGPTDTCSCGSDTFERLSTDEALSQLSGNSDP